jgi:hypothetical protein
MSTRSIDFWAHVLDLVKMEIGKVNPTCLVRTGDIKIKYTHYSLALFQLS